MRALLTCSTLLLLISAATAHAEGRAHPSAEAVQPLPVGSVVPAVRVKTVRGESVDLSRLVRDRGALLVFYRGGW